MTLEAAQQRRNREAVFTSSASASLDPKQVPHDLTELLIKGAEAAATGGSVEDTLAIVSRELRRQKRKDQNVTAADVIRQMSQAQKTITDDVGSPEVRGVNYVQDDDEAFAFGEDVDYNYTQGGKKITRADDEQTYRADDRGFTEDEETGLLRRETFDESRGEQVDIAPSSVLTDALSQLQRAKAEQSGLSSKLSGVFGGSNQDIEGLAQVEGRLEDSIPSSGAESAAQKALVSELIKRDSERFSPSVRAENDEYVANIANYIGQQFTAGGRGTMADEAIGRIGEVQSLGKAGETKHVIRFDGDSSAFPAATQNANGIYVDPRTGQPIAVQETLPTALAGSNTPNTANQLNAPTRESSTEFVARRMPDYRTGGRVFGDYPQIDITGATTLFADRVKDLAVGGFEQASAMPDDIRSIDEFDRTIGMIREEGLRRGKKFYDMEKTDTGVKSKRTMDPGPEAVLNFLRYTPAEAEALAGALYQLDSARRSSVNQNPDSMYFTRTGPRGRMEDVSFDAAEAISPRDGAAPVAKFTRGERIEGKQVSEAIRGLSPEAAMPFKGAVAGEEQPILRQTKVPTEQSPGRKGPEYIRQIRAARGQNQTPEDIEETRKLQVNNIVAEERAKRSASEREQKERDIKARRGKPPKQKKVFGDASAQRQVEDDARRQSEDMAFSDLIRSIRSRRG